IDPVCGMHVAPETAPASIEHEGKDYFFCCGNCLTKFRTDPDQFLKASIPIPIRPRLAKIADSPEYTCPMHPEVVRNGPGSCPICGMALEPRTVSVDDGENPELSSMARRFWLAVVLTLPLLAIAMSDLVPGKPLTRLLSMDTLGWIELLLATPVVLWCG